MYSHLISSLDNLMMIYIEGRNMQLYIISSSSIGATTLGGFWPALRFRSTIFYLYTSLSNFSLSSPLNLLLLVRAISVLVFLLSWWTWFPFSYFFKFLLCPFWLLGRSRRRWVDNIRMDLQEVRCGYMDWIGLAQDTERWRTLVSAVMNRRVPWNAGNFLTSCKPSQEGLCTME